MGGTAAALAKERASHKGGLINSAHHVPVLADSVARLASVRAGEVWVDCTTGFGGHSARLLADGAEVYGIDQDADARQAACKRLAEFGDRFHPIAGNFRHLTALLEAAGLDRVDGILADIGVSSWQLDQPERGFSFRLAGPVDMRMDPSTGQSAEALIRTSSVPELAGLIRQYGEEPYAGPVARGLVAWAAAEGPHDTATLADAVRQAIPKKAQVKRGHHPATRTFQALRIAVNDELGALEALLADAPDCLSMDGRLLIISFHSLEDRLVKRAFNALTRPPQSPRRGLPPPPGGEVKFKALTRKPVVADTAEIEENPRARSARLRAIQRIGQRIGQPSGQHGGVAA